MAKGLWKLAYASFEEHDVHWAEICQSYFDRNRVNNWNFTVPIATREQLRKRWTIPRDTSWCGRCST